MNRVATPWALPALVLSLTLGACSPSPSPDRPGQVEEEAAAAIAPPVPAGLEEAHLETRRRVDELLEAIRANPEDAGAWAALGHRYRREDWLAEAATVFGRAATLDTKPARWLYLQGHCLNGAADATGALNAFREAARLDPDYAPTQFYLARELLAIGAAEEADLLLESATILAPTNSYPPLLRGQAAMKRGEHEAALAHLQVAMRRRPQHGEVYEALALLFQALGREELEAKAQETASQVPAKALFFDPWLDNPAGPLGATARLAEAERLAAETQLRSAEEQVRAVLLHEPEHAEAHRMLGLLLWRRGEHAEAERELREAVRLEPETVSVHVSLADYLLRQDREVEALEPLSVILRLEPWAASTRAVLARVLARLGDGDEAWALLCEGIRAAEANGEQPHEALLTQRDEWIEGPGPPGGCESSR